MPRHANLGAIWDVLTVDTGAGLALAVSLVAGGAGGASDVDILSGPTGANALQIQGTTAPLAAALGYPVQVGGTNAGAVLRAALIDTSVNGEGAFVVAALRSDGEGVAFPMSGGRLLVSNTAEPASLGQKTAANSFPVVWASDAALPAGANNIGDVDVLSLPALPAGTNNIGDVDVLSLPALPAGNNNIGDVDIASLPGASFVSGTADAVVKSGAGKLIAIQLCAADAADCAITVYDNTSASGTIIVQLKATALTDTNFCPAYAINVTNGIYVDVTTGGPPRWTAVYI